MTAKKQGKTKWTLSFWKNWTNYVIYAVFPSQLPLATRDPSHSIEAKKDNPGMHTRGIAADVYSGVDRYKLLMTAFSMGFTGIGVAKTFIHVDTRNSQPVVWTYQ